MKAIVILALFLGGHSVFASGFIQKQNWITQLSKEEVKRMMGSQEEPHKSLDYSDAYKGQTGYEELDWRNRDGINWLGDVMNQGNCGSCVAFAAIATLEAQTSITNQVPWLRPFLSPQALFACGGGSCEQGWFPSSAGSYLTRNGAVEASCSPYLSGTTGEDVACKQFCSDQSSRTHVVKRAYSASSGWGGNVQAVKEALKKGPLITTMTVYEDFISYSSGIYRSTSRTRLGGHAISLVGYSDSGRYWIIRNSWGSDWGEGGYARISWDDKSGVGSWAMGFELDPQNNSLAITTPRENQYVAGSIELKAQVKNEAPLNFKIINKNGRQVQSVLCNNFVGSFCIAELATTGLADGSYEIYAETTDGKVRSIVRPFTVLNSVPQYAISYAPIGNVDLNRPLQGRIEFNISTTGTPVAAQELHFIAERLDGTVVFNRTFDMVLPKMKLGFRTNAIPNGDYNIYYTLESHVPGHDYVTQAEHHRITVRN